MNFKSEDDQVIPELPTFSTSRPEKRIGTEEKKVSPANDKVGQMTAVADDQELFPDRRPAREYVLSEAGGDEVSTLPDLDSGPLDGQPAGAGQADEALPSGAGEAGADEAQLAEGEAGGAANGWEITKAVIREIVETVVLTLIIFFLIQSVIRNFRVDGHSMDPNLHHGEYLIVDKVSYRLPFEWRTPQRGDVIVFEAPSQPDKDFVKRIIGLPGETIEIRQGQVFINGAAYDEPFGALKDRFSMGPRTVSEGEYFVMGDNRGNSNDSRNWGSLPFDKVVGRAWISYWPPQSWGAIPNDGPTSSATLFNWFDRAEASP